MQELQPWIFRKKPPGGHAMRQGSSDSSWLELQEKAAADKEQATFYTQRQREKLSHCGSSHLCCLVTRPAYRSRQVHGSSRKCPWEQALPRALSLLPSL